MGPTAKIIGRGTQNAYHIYWLSEGASGVYEFEPPVFYIAQGVAKFINGRHRTLVLRKHMPAIPMALAHIDGCLTFSPAPQLTSQQVLEAIVVSKLDGNEIFEFPDLAIEYLGYDHNLGK